MQRRRARAPTGPTGLFNRFIPLGLLDLLVPIALGLGGCGPSPEVGAGSRLRVAFDLEKGGSPVACASRSEVEGLRVSAWTADRLSPRAGFPVMYPASACADGTLELPPLPDGDHRLEVSALGVLGGTPGSVLFEADVPVTTPRAEPLALTLRPEVAYLSISWTFEDLGLLPCVTEVEDVEVIVSAGGRSSLTRRFDCDAMPASIPVPLPLASSTIQIDAYSPEGFILFYATEQRVLARGENAFSATLGSTGGSIYLDWDFRIDGQSIRPCDDGRVSVVHVDASVRNLAGGPVASERIPCGEDRPIAFRPQRYPPGQELEIELVAEGPNARFRGVERLIMPEGDRLTDPPIALEAVGSATVTLSVARPECEALGVDDVEISLAEVVGQGAVTRLTRRLPAASRATRFDDLPYGEYQVDLALRVAERAVCSVSGRREISAPSNVWEPFVF